MSNETLSRILGAAVGAALIVAGMAAFAPGTINSASGSSAQSAVSPVASLHASETVNVYSRN